MKHIAIVQFPGSNCERETKLAVKRAGMEPVEFLWNEPLDKLRQMDGYVIVGGFSYEDRSRAGIIAALDPVMQEIKKQSARGKPVLGICNGAQILVETGLVPGIDGDRLSLVLTENKRIAQGKILGTGFYNAWVTIRLSDNHKPNAFTRHLSTQDKLHIPVAHAEGRFVMPVSLLRQLQEEGLQVFQYCDEQGNITENFPVNPNGSMANIAAIANKAGNVMAIMPHPERTRNGDRIFQSMHDYIVKTTPGSEISQKDAHALSIPPFKKNNESYECLVKLIITDNQALTVQKTLQNLGFPVIVKRFEHWEINCETAGLHEQIKQTDVLYCDRKEHEIAPATLDTASSLFYLVRSKEDIIGQQKLQMLQDHYALKGIDKIHHGVLWQFFCEQGDVRKLIDTILQTNIISNEYAHDCFQYCA